MNIDDIRNAIEYLKNNSNCPNCEKPYEDQDINVIASTKSEGLFEARCPHCHCSSIVNVMFTPDPHIKKEKAPAAKTMPAGIPTGGMPRLHRKVSQDDILDMKNFLNKFDGNFKKLFTKND